MQTRKRGRGALLIAMLTLTLGLGACTRGGASAGGAPAPAPGGDQAAGSVGGSGGVSLPGVRHSRLTYGPFTVPPAKNGKMMGMTNGFRFNVRKPCSNCYIVRFRSSLTDTGGREVNVDTGYWLHHMVLANMGSTNLACGNMPGEPFWTAGNERTVIDLTKSGPYGYPVKPMDSWQLIAELANLTKAPEIQNVTVDFDWVPMGTAGIRAARPLWIDMSPTHCTAEQPPHQGKYTVTPTIPWTASTNGRLIYAHAHMHDGATNEEVLVNGRVVCDSKQNYGETPSYVEGPNASMPGTPHISSVGQCQGTAEKPLVSFRFGDRLTVRAHYDDSAHKQMGTEEIMGIVHSWFVPGA